MRNGYYYVNSGVHSFFENFIYKQKQNKNNGKNKH